MENERTKLSNKHTLLENQYLIEGIDIDRKNRVVSFNPGHENNVNTSLKNNPTYSEVDGFTVISIFKRLKSDEHDLDGNPLIYALKDINGWKFKNPESDIINLLKQFVRITEKLRATYDTIIIIPSSNELNVKFLHRLNKIIKAKYTINDWLSKLPSEDVIDEFVDWKLMGEDFPGMDYAFYERKLDQSFISMRTENDGVFSYKFINPAKLRKYIKRTMFSKKNKTIEYAPIINGKNVLILDDTIAYGQTISEACKEILDTYVPNSLTIITLFSKV